LGEDGDDPVHGRVTQEYRIQTLVAGVAHDEEQVEVFLPGARFSEGVFLAPAFLPAFLVPDFPDVGFFSEAAPLAVVFFFAWRVALPEARFAVALFVVVPFFLVTDFLVAAFSFTDDFLAAGLLTAVERLAVFSLVRTARRPRLARAGTSSADVSSMSMPKTDDSSADSSTLPRPDLPPGGG